MDRLKVGSQCEAAFREAAKASLEAQKQQRLDEGGSEYRDRITRLRTIPVHKRADWLGRDLIRKLRTIPVQELGDWLGSEKYEQHRHDVETELRAMTATPMEGETNAPRLLSIAPKKPAGVRAAIIAEVTRKWTEQLGRPISESTVTKCWEEARAMERSLSEDDDGEAVV